MDTKAAVLVACLILCGALIGLVLAVRFVWSLYVERCNTLDAPSDKCDRSQSEYAGRK